MGRVSEGGAISGGQIKSLGQREREADSALKARLWDKDSEPLNLVKLSFPRVEYWVVTDDGVRTAILSTIEEVERYVAVLRGTKTGE